MIEMRWLVRPAEKRDGPIFFQDAAHPPDEAYERVLQYRVLQQNRRATAVCLDHWGDWQDVPTV